LSDDADVTQGFAVCADLELGLKAMSSGLAPVWVLVGAAAAVGLPDLAGVEITAVK